MSNHIPVPRPVPVPRPNRNESQNNGPLIAVTVAAGILLLVLLFAMLRGCNSGGMGDSGSGDGAGAGTQGTADGDGGHGDGSSDGGGGTSGGASQGTEDEDKPAQKAGSESAEKETESQNTSSVEQSASEQGDTSEKPMENNEEENKSETRKKAEEKEPKQSLADKLSGAVTDKDQPEEEKEETRQGGGFLGKGDAEISFFGAKGKGSRFVYVIDHSGSMAGLPLEVAKKEMLNGLDLLKEHHKFNVIFYDDQFISWTNGKLFPATDKNKKDAKRFVNGVPPAGGTVPEPALVQAIDAKPEYIFFLTDGEFSLNLDQMCAFANKNKVHINVIQFGGNSTPKSLLLQELAKRTKGDYRFINIGSLDAL